MRLPEYVMDMRGSGIYSHDEETTLDEACECGSRDGIRFTDDWGRVTVECGECRTEIREEFPEEPDPDHERDLWLEREWEDRYERDNYPDE